MSNVATSTRSLLSQAAANTASLLTTDVLNKATTFAVYALVARYTDARSFGQLSLGLLLLYTFQVFACVGLPTLITRELSLDRNHTAKYLANASAVVTCSSLLASLLMVLFAWGMQYAADTTNVLGILALALLPHSLASVAEAGFRAWERMQYIAYANVPANLLKVLAAYLLLDFGYGVIAIAIMLVVCRVVIVLTEWVMFALAIERPQLRVEWDCAKDLLRRSFTFLSIDGLVAIWNSLDVVLISKLCGEADVGLYSAACQLLVPAKLFFNSVVNSVFPIMCRKVKVNVIQLAGFVTWLIEFLMMIGLPTAVALFFLARPSLLLLYGDAGFEQATGIVRILVMALLFQIYTSVFGNALWAGWREGITLRIIAINLVIELFLGLIFIYYFGILGAAFASLITCAVNATQHYFAATDMMGPLPILRVTWRPLAATVAMAACFVVLRFSGDIAAFVVSTIAYCALIGALLIQAAGGLSKFRTAYFAPLLK